MKGVFFSQNILEITFTIKMSLYITAFHEFRFYWSRKVWSNTTVLLNPTHHGVLEISPVTGRGVLYPPIFFGNYISYEVLVVICNYIPAKQVCKAIFRPPRFSPVALWPVLGQNDVILDQNRLK